MSAPASPLRLSVVFVARHSLLYIQKTLECLLAQTAASRIELILSADSPDLLREAEDFLAPHACFEKSCFLLHRTRDLAQARALSVAEATGDAVAFSEDHSFPEPNWAEELLEAFYSSEEIQAAAPAMLNPNPETAVSRVQFLLFFGCSKNDSSSHVRFEIADGLPWHNTAYRRNALAEAIHDENSFLIEGFLQREIRTNRSQARFVRCPHTCVTHVNMSRFCPAIKHAFLGGRIFGSERAKQLGWGPAAKVLRFVVFPLVPLMVIHRSASLLRDESSLANTVSNLCTAYTLKLVHAFGESFGTCFGLGSAAGAYADLECARMRFVRPAERSNLLSMQDPSASPRNGKGR